MSRRDQIRMTPPEAAAFVEQQRVLTCATLGPRGWPHLMPLWYVVRAGELWSWTYAKSQKVRNLERDNRATIQIENGDSYDELRGVMIEAQTELHHELEVVSGLGGELAQRYGGGSVTPDALQAIRAQASKRVALRFVVARTTSWDHRKLASGH